LKIYLYIMSITNIIMYFIIRQTDLFRYNVSLNYRGNFFFLLNYHNWLYYIPVHHTTQTHRAFFHVFLTILISRSIRLPSHYRCPTCISRLELPIWDKFLHNNIVFCKICFLLLYFELPIDDVIKFLFIRN